MGDTREREPSAPDGGAPLPGSGRRPDVRRARGRHPAVAAALLLAMAVPVPGRTDTPAAAGPLKPTTARAFERHVERVEASIDRRVRGEHPFLWADESPARLVRLRRGDVVAEPTSGVSPIEVSGGLVHDWTGAVFIPGVGLADTLGLVQDYDRHKNVYPEVIASKLVARDGNRFIVYLRLRKKKVLTVVLDTIHDARYFPLDATRVYSRSRSTVVTEVEDPGTRNERQVPAGEDHGFMRFLNSYWRFAARDGGVYVECQAVSLSRAIPFGLGWLIGPIVNDLPRESLVNTLQATRATLIARRAPPRLHP